MSKAANTILLTGNLEPYEEAYVVTAAVKPGFLVEKISTGVRPHATAGARASGAIAIEDALQGKTIDDSYAVGELCRYIFPQSGDLVQIVLHAQEDAAANIAYGDFLISMGNGKFRKAANATEIGLSFAKAEEALNLSGAGAVDGFLTVRVL